MSSEEEIPLDSSSPSKCGSGKKRVRQRVDAGEPRNSYASIPNFSSRPPCSPLAALYSNGYAASKMLADLLGSSSRQQSQEMIVLEGGVQQPRNGILNGGRMFLKNDFCEVVERCSSGSDSDSSHLLRDILQQGRGGGVGGDSHAPQSPNPESEKDAEESPPDNEMSAEGMVSESPSPSSAPCWPVGDTSLESKRARVETIVSNMVPKSNGTGHHEQPPPVNGCKKRKLYQPQQHEKRGDCDEEEDESMSSPATKRRNSNGGGLFTFRQQLRHMQQQLVAMQQQYMEMVDGDSSDDDRPKSRHSEPDLKPISKTEVLDYDNASMYDNGEPRRLVIDDSSKEKRQTDGQCSPPSADYEWLAESLKAELSTSLSQVVDAVVSRCRKALNNNNSSSSSKPQQDALQQQESKDPPLLLSQMLDRKSPRTGGKVIDRGTRVTNGGPYPPQEMTPKVAPFYFPLKPPASVAATAAFLYGSPPAPYHSTPSSSPSHHQDPPEQTEAMSLVVASKKKRHKVTDTRLRQPTQDPLGGSPSKYDTPQMYPPPPLVPVSLPTSVAIPNPSLIHQSSAEIFHHHHSSSFDHHHPFGRLHFLEQQTPRQTDDDDVHHPLHPLLTPYHRGSPDYHHLKTDSADMSDAGGDSPANYGDNMAMTSTLTPMHLRKAKLMFFFARYPSSAVLKMYFPDIRFNKNNTAQLVKWFSNFREFFYIQMEKYARQAITEGVKAAEDLKVTADSELLRVLNLHYNRNNHIPSPEQFRYVVEQTLREFYKALVAGKDSEQSWKKSIYKIIARMDDSVPDYFKSPNFLDTLE